MNKSDLKRLFIKKKFGCRYTTYLAGFFAFYSKTLLKNTYLVEKSKTDLLTYNLISKNRHICYIVYWIWWKKINRYFNKKQKQVFPILQTGKYLKTIELVYELRPVLITYVFSSIRHIISCHTYLWISNGAHKPTDLHNQEKNLVVLDRNRQNNNSTWFSLFHSHELK